MGRDMANLFYYFAILCFSFVEISMLDVPFLPSVTSSSYSEPGLTCVNSIGQPSVRTGLGVVYGRYLESRDGRKFEGYLGIKFAKADRLESPEEYTEKFICKDASKPAPVCLQRYNDKIIGVEDCLTLNIYRPKREINTERDKLPVLLYLVKGRFQSELTNLDDLGPQFIMDGNCILVAPNYRVGWPGLTSLEDDVLPGNYALKDQLAAMKWVQHHIESFGGDPNRVTLWGCSAGSISITLHLISPVSQGLFHQAILESGNILDFSALSHPGQVRNISLEFVSSVGCYRSDSKSIKECLKKLPATKLIPSKEFNDKLIESNPPTTRLLTIEPKHKDAFLTEDPYVLLKKGNYKLVRIAIGITSQDGAVISDPLFTYNRSYVDWCLAEYKKCFPVQFGYKYTADDEDRQSESVYRFYFTNETGRNDSLFQRFTDACTDRVFYQPMANFVLWHKAKTVYIYYQNYRNKISYSEKYGNQIVKGPTHADQTIGQFSSKKIPPLKGLDLYVSKRAEMWVYNFTTYGNPNGVGCHQPWKPVSTDSLQALILNPDGSIVMSENIRKSGYDVWQYSGIKDVNLLFLPSLPSLPSTPSTTSLEPGSTCVNSIGQPFVRTGLGVVFGRYLETLDGRKFEGYLGIQFAKANRLEVKSNSIHKRIDQYCALCR